MAWAILGGSFDPFHNGHIHLALCLKEAHNLEKVVFVPSGRSPVAKPLIASAKERLAMTQLGVEGIEGLSVSDIEIGGSPYTIDTVRALRPDHIILGEDAAKSLSDWKEAEALVALAPPLIAGRPGSRLAERKELITNVPELDISSTEIRKRLGLGLYVGHLVPAKVLDHIMANRVYSFPQ